MDLLVALGSLFRATPSFRGKYRLVHALARLVSSSSPDGGVRTVRMKDGSLMLLDYRSLTERVAFWTGEYEHDAILRCAACLDKDSVVLDVGANIGFYSIALGRMLKAGGRICAFEPVPANYERLKRNVALNGLENVVFPFRLALGDHEGEVELGLLEPGGSLTGNAVIMEGHVASRSSRFSAPLLPLDRFAEQHQITSCRLLKIDVEGAEVMVLRGARGFIERHRPIISAECNNLFIKQLGTSFMDVVDIVVPLGYRIYRERLIRSGSSSAVHTGEYVYVPRPEVGIEYVFLVPEETPVDTRGKIGLID